MIRCIWRRSIFDPTKRDVWESEWTPAASVASMIPDPIRGQEGLRVTRNGHTVERDDWGQLLGPEDLVEFDVLPGEVFSLGNILATATIAATSVTAAAPYAPLFAFADLVGTALIATVVGNLLHDKPPKSGQADSATYGFGGVGANPAYNGAPYPFVFGEMRVSGPIINVFTQALTDQDEFLYVLVMVAGHEVAQIGDKTADGGPFTTQNGDLPAGMELDGEPIENFDDVEVFVRMGTADQEIIPGFAQPVLQYSIGREIRVGESPGSLEQTPGVYEFDDSEITDWDTPVSHQTDAEADNFTLLLRFPRGLVQFNSDSTTPKNQTVRFQVRYRRATNGNPVGDYVVLPAFDVTAKKQAPFTFQYQRDFIDPASYVEPTLGYYLDLTGASNDRASNSSQTLSSQTGTDVQFTVFAWVLLTNTSTFDSTNRVFGHFGGGAGWGLTITGSYVSNTRAGLTATIGNGSTLVGHSDDYSDYLTDALQSGEWTLVGYTYEANCHANGEGELRFYCNGKLIGRKNVGTSNQAVWPTSQPVVVGAANTSGTASIDGSIDEVVVYERALSAVEMQSKYNGGSPAPSTSSETGIVAGWHLDATNTGGTTTPDFVGSADLTLGGGATITSGTNYGVVYDDAEGDLLRDRYLVEIQRITADATNELSQDIAELATVQLTLYEEQSHPGLALVGVKMRASGQINSQPSVTVPVRGYNRCPVWDGEDAANPTLELKFSRNPAWILAAAATNAKLGAGAIYKTTDIDWAAFLDAANYFDEKVPANEIKDSSGSPTQLQIAVVKAQVFQASSAVGEDAKFTSGMVQIQVEDGAYPAAWPQLMDTSVTAEDAEHWIVFENVDVTGIPSWLQDLDGDKLAVGFVTYDSVGGVGGGGGGGGAGVFEIWVHTDSDPATDDTYTPSTGESPVVERWERRMEFDGVFDRGDLPRWEAFRVIAKSARATPIPVAGKLTLWYDAPRSIDNMIGMGNIVAGSFATTYTGIADRPNVIEGTFLDRALGYEQVPVVARHPDVINPANLNDVRVSQESFEGITRRTQLERHIRYKLNTFNLSRRVFEATVGPDQIGLAVGNRLAVSHDVAGWGRSGRLIETSANTTTVYLDQPVTLETGTTYQVLVRNPTTHENETRTISSATGSYDAGEALTVSSGFSFTPSADDVYAFGETSKTHMDFLVIDNRLDTRTLTRQIACLAYDAQNYTDDYGTFPTAVVSYLTPPEVSS